jgi:hypothetical protein
VERNLSQLNPFWSFFLFTSKWEVQKNYALVGDAIREVHLYTLSSH